ncbi:exosome protein [Nitrosopumilus sp. K4]|uniref:RNA-binding domain-containing protein n=1 Tax=Nitrosopumilus sp. K4 TaxID=2795383 RepID=UPI001BACCE74|nr:RNA-binding domain-containing protein [Nitrosopumilus sp. K4]QUC64844.1 exosome protein [Nitrosopumilus sp. K4]
MAEKLEASINVIIHATEDISKFFEAFNEMFELEDEDFSIEHTTGHFDNPITILNAKLVKKQAIKFMEKFIKNISKEQLSIMINEIEERTVDSRYNIRFDKQEFIKGKIEFQEKEAIKLKIHTPIYNKKNTIKTFTEIFQLAN